MSSICAKLRFGGSHLRLRQKWTMHFPNELARLKHLRSGAQHAQPLQHGTKWRLDNRAIGTCSRNRTSRARGGERTQSSMKKGEGVKDPLSRGDSRSFRLRFGKCAREWCAFDALKRRGMWDWWHALTPVHPFEGRFAKLRQKWQVEFPT